jgi:hypothetical protein
MDRNEDMRLLAGHALARGRLGQVELVAGAMKVSSELRLLAEAVYDAGAAGKLDAGWGDLVVTLLGLIARDDERAAFVERLVGPDPEAAVRFATGAVETDGGRRRIAEELARAGHERQALAVSALLDEDAGREALFWFAVASRTAPLVDAVVASIEDDALRARCAAIARASG